MKENQLEYADEAKSRALFHDELSKSNCYNIRKILRGIM